jgi:hypothetical protein
LGGVGEKAEAGAGEGNGVGSEGEIRRHGAAPEVSIEGRGEAGRQGIPDKCKSSGGGVRKHLR